MKTSSRPSSGSVNLLYFSYLLTSLIYFTFAIVRKTGYQTEENFLSACGYKALKKWQTCNSSHIMYAVHVLLLAHICPYTVYDTIHVSIAPVRTCAPFPSSVPLAGQSILHDISTCGTPIYNHFAVLRSAVDYCVKISCLLASFFSELSQNFSVSPSNVFFPSYSRQSCSQQCWSKMAVEVL